MRVSSGDQVASLTPFLWPVSMYAWVGLAELTTLMTTSLHSPSHQLCPAGYPAASKHSL